MTKTANEHCCEEASVRSTDEYIPCNKRGAFIVEADGAELIMCDICAHHSESNRGMNIIGPYDNPLPPPIGDNSPPDAIDEATAPYADAISEAQNWLDGEPVENEGQMKAVDSLTKQIKLAIKDTKAGQKSESLPHFDAHKAAIARWKPTIDDLTLLSTGLVACVAGYKQKLADEKAEAQRKAWKESDDKRREAERVAAQAAASDIDAQREAQAAKQAAMDAEKAAKAQAKDGVKGMRKVHKYEISDHRAALHFIAKNHRDDVTAFVENWVQKNHKTVNIDGVEQSISKEAF